MTFLLFKNHQHHIQVRIEIDGVDAESFFVNEGVERVFTIFKIHYFLLG